MKVYFILIPPTTLLSIFNLLTAYARMLLLQLKRFQKIGGRREHNPLGGIWSRIHSVSVAWEVSTIVTIWSLACPCIS